MGLFHLLLKSSKPFFERHNPRLRPRHLQPEVWMKLKGHKRPRNRLMMGDKNFWTTKKWCPKTKSLEISKGFLLAMFFLKDSRYKGFVGNVFLFEGGTYFLWKCILLNLFGHGVCTKVSTNWYFLGWVVEISVLLFLCLFCCVLVWFVGLFVYVSACLFLHLPTNLFLSIPSFIYLDLSGYRGRDTIYAHIQPTLWGDSEGTWWISNLKTKMQGLVYLCTIIFRVSHKTPTQSP